MGPGVRVVVETGQRWQQECLAGGIPIDALVNSPKTSEPAISLPPLRCSGIAVPAGLKLSAKPMISPVFASQNGR